MAEAQVVTARPDIDIEADIHRLFRYYPPLNNDRHRVSVSVRNGVVTVRGYVKAGVTHQYLLEHIEGVKGVRDIDAAELFNDEDIRLEAGRAVPPGVTVIVEYGAVILSGKLPEGVELEALVRQVGLLPGVHRVITNFR